MSKFIITGKKALNGEIKISGAKNAALKIIAASLLSEEEILIKNVPEIEDVQRMLDILIDMGAQIESSKDGLRISTKDVKSSDLNVELVPKLRASMMLVGPLLLRIGEVKLPHPGGCAIGKRPIDIWIEGFKAMGVKVSEGKDYYLFKADKLKGARFVFPRVTVTLTEAMMMTATLVPGKTILVNAAEEPEIPALAEYLNKQGAKIKGAGTSMIEIEGVSKLRAGEFIVMPDRIEAGSFVVMGALTPGKIRVTDCEPEHLEVFLKILKEAGVNFKIGKDWIEVGESRGLKARDVVTREYPGFATDLQAPYTVLATQAKGHSIIRETIFEGRMFYTDILNRMGADITMCDPYRIIVEGPTKLYGKKMESPDLRAGIALLIAALGAEGVSEIDNIYQIDRGYERIEERLQGLGAEIRRTD